MRVCAEAMFPSRDVASLTAAMALSVVVLSMGLGSGSKGCGGAYLDFQWSKSLVRKSTVTFSLRAAVGSAVWTGVGAPSLDVASSITAINLAAPVAF